MNVSKDKCKCEDLNIQPSSHKTTSDNILRIFSIISLFISLCNINTTTTKEWTEEEKEKEKENTNYCIFVQ